MKRVLSILIAGSFTFVLALAAAANDEPADPELQSPPAEGIEVPPPSGDDGSADQQDALGDPHDLGGGFRDHTSPPVPVEVDQAFQLPRLILVLMRLR